MRCQVLLVQSWPSGEHPAAVQAATKGRCTRWDSRAVNTICCIMSPASGTGTSELDSSTGSVHCSAHRHQQQHKEDKPSTTSHTMTIAPIRCCSIITHPALDPSKNCCRGFRVAEVAPPGQGPPWAHQCRLPPGCSDLVTVLPGPPSMAAAELLAEARRLMAKGGYLAVAWNDR